MSIASWMTSTITHGSKATAGGWSATLGDCWSDRSSIERRFARAAGVRGRETEKPLAQDDENRRPIVNDGEVLDTHVACPPLTPEERRAVDKLKPRPRHASSPRPIRCASEDRAQELAKRTGKPIEEARQIIENQRRDVLLPDHVLEFSDKELKGCTVGDVLKDPEQFKDRTLADPIEGVSYGRQTAKVMLRIPGDKRPTLYQIVCTWRHEIHACEATVESKPRPSHRPHCSLDQVHDVFRKWFGDQYDLDACDVVCAVGASEQLSGDPVWLMMVSGAGTAKTETVQAVDGAGAHVISTITSDGALLSATEAKGSKQKKASATGGLLRKIGERGILVIKDFTSILSSDRNMRGCGAGRVP